jgi:hypothetical protein
MSRSIDVVRLSGDEYDRLMDEREILRQEAARAWREVDAIARERDVLARTVNAQEAALSKLRSVAEMPAAGTVNRYCRAGMCLQTDAEHEPWCEHHKTPNDRIEP